MAPLHITEQPSPSHILSARIPPHTVYSMLHSIYILVLSRPDPVPRPDHTTERSDRSQYAEIEQRARIPPHSTACYTLYISSRPQIAEIRFLCVQRRERFFSFFMCSSALMRAPWNTGAHLSCRRSPPHSWRHSYGQHISTSSSVHRWTSRPSKA